MRNLSVLFEGNIVEKLGVHSDSESFVHITVEALESPGEFLPVSIRFLMTSEMSGVAIAKNKSARTSADI